MRIPGGQLSASSMSASAGEAGAVWARLGADVQRVDDETIEARWGDAPLAVRIVAGDDVGARGLRFTDAVHLDHDPVLGPPVIAV